ncbi:MAG TPA: hypothetical protein VF432_25210 [Thermoanaerobaculia bacterium]
MKRDVFATLRRGVDNAVANWGLIVVRVVEVLALAGIAIAAALAVIVPVLVSIGITVTGISTPEDLEELILSLYARWVWMIWIFLGISVLLLVFVAIHSFVEAGCARVAVDADRAAGPAVDGPRSRYHVFSLQRWWAGAKDGWWTVFWIYNLAWGVAGLILLLPLVPTAVIMLMARDTPAMLIGTGCIGLTVTLLLFIVVGIVTSMWTARATVEWATTRAGAAAALSDAWAAIKADVGRHLLIALAVVVIAMAGSSFFATFSYFAAFGEMFHRSGVVQVFTIPLRLFGTLLNWGFSAFVSSWYLAAYGALAVEKRS